MHVTYSIQVSKPYGYYLLYQHHHHHFISSKGRRFYIRYSKRLFYISCGTCCIFTFPSTCLAGTHTTYTYIYMYIYITCLLLRMQIAFCLSFSIDNLNVYLLESQFEISPYCSYFSLGTRRTERITVLYVGFLACISCSFSITSFFHRRSTVEKLVSVYYRSYRKDAETRFVHVFVAVGMKFGILVKLPGKEGGSLVFR